jgi:5-methyltetrahydropteroyltriglutamate--homocysteine methyltransferase
MPGGIIQAATAISAGSSTPGFIRGPCLVHNPQMILARADHVGSLLRPPELIDARAALATGELTPPAFKAIEDEAVREVIAGQERAGMPVVTDGEYRRESFQDQIASAVAGFTGAGMGAWLWGEWHSEEVGDATFDRPADLAVVEPLRQRRMLATEEFTFARATTGRIVKVTLPSPSLYANLWAPERSSDAYPSLESFLEAVTEILIREVRELERLGCTYVQLDAPHYPLLIEPGWRAFYESRGWTLDAWLSLGVDLDNAVIAAAPGITFGFHLCRGNQGSRWLVEGSYAPIARPIFSRIRAHRLLLEYDDSRSGGFEPLEHVSRDALVVLGLVTTKSARRETVAELRARVLEASAIVPLERLAVGTQCGFSTSVMGNAITSDDQWRKLEVIAQTAAELWP